MLLKRSLGDKIFDSINVIFMVLVIIVMLLPFILVFNGSIVTENEFIRSGGVILFPKSFSLSTYEFLFREGSLLPSFFLKNFTPPAIRAATITSATIRRIVRRRFFLSAVLFSGFFAGVSGDAGAAVSAGVSSFFSSMISAMSFLLYDSQGPE